MSTENFEEWLRDKVSKIRYKDDYELICERDKLDPQGRLYLQVKCWRPDSTTGEMGYGYGGKFYLSAWVTKSELVQRAFSLFLAYEEHECREFFKWEGRAIYNPHHDVDLLWSIADRFDVRA